MDALKEVKSALEEALRAVNAALGKDSKVEDTEGEEEDMEEEANEEESEESSVPDKKKILLIGLKKKLGK
jgi:hypothetical protein